MPRRKVVFANGYYYHIYNRGVNRQGIFEGTEYYLRFERTVEYYRRTNHKLKLSYYLRNEVDSQSAYLNSLAQEGSGIGFSLIAYCLMPNHFHLLIRQENSGGIVSGMSHIGNSYTKYFNEKQKRSGHLFQGRYQAVLIENEEQLVHVSRYIHLNPLVAGLVRLGELTQFSHSSLSQYAHNRPLGSVLVETKEILHRFRNEEDYLAFVLDQADYAKSLHKNLRLYLDEDLG